MRGFRSRSTVEEIHRLIDDRIAALDQESIPLSAGFRRVLARDITSAVSVPSFNRSAMDGYAVRGEETFGADLYLPARFRLIGRSRPGKAFSGTLGAGEAVEIATGAPIPEGANAVVKVESTCVDGSILHVVEPTPPGRHIGSIGEDVSVGVRVFEAGRVLRPQDLGVMSALGQDHLNVIARPLVTLIVTGDELMPAGSASRDHLLPDMNSVMLNALITRDGGLSRTVGPLVDDREIIREAILSAITNSDAVFVCGGSSTGPEDHAPSIVAEVGELSRHGVALRPASPFGLGFVAEVPVALLPGNPVSCLCAYDFFGCRIVRRQGGRPPDWPYRPIDLSLDEKLTSSLGRVDYTRVMIHDGGVRPLATSGASILSGACRADGFVVVPADREGYPPGITVRVWLYD